MKQKVLKTTASGRTTYSCRSCTSPQVWPCLEPCRAFQSRVYSLLRENIHRAPCGCEVVVVINLHERHYRGLQGDLSHGSCQFWGLVVNASHHSMAVGAIRDAIIGILPLSHLVTMNTTFSGFMNLCISMATTWAYSLRLFLKLVY